LLFSTYPFFFCNTGHDFAMQVVNVLGFSMPYYKSPTLLLSLGLSIRVFWHLIMTRPDVIHVSSPGFLVFAGILYAKLLDLPLVVSYHTHVPGTTLKCQPCRTRLVSKLHPLVWPFAVMFCASLVQQNVADPHGACMQSDVSAANVQITSQDTSCGRGWWHPCGWSYASAPGSRM